MARPEEPTKPTVSPCSTRSPARRPGGERRQVQVARLVARCVAQAHHAAVGPVVRHRHHGAARRGDHGRAHRRGVVDAAMRARRVQHRMTAARREPRRDPRLELERRSKEEPPQRLAGLVVVAGLAAGRREADRAQHAAVVPELGRRDVSVGGGHRPRACSARTPARSRRPGCKSLLKSTSPEKMPARSTASWSRFPDGVHRLEERRRVAVDAARRDGVFQRPRDRHELGRPRRGARDGRLDPQEGVRRRPRTRTGAARPRACARARTAAATAAAAGSNTRAAACTTATAASSATPWPRSSVSSVVRWGMRPLTRVVSGTSATSRAMFPTAVTTAGTRSAAAGASTPARRATDRSHQPADARRQPGVIASCVGRSPVFYLKLFQQVLGL